MRESLKELGFCFIVALLVLWILVTIQNVTLKHRDPIERDTYADAIVIKGKPVEADPPVIEAQEAWITSDTPEDDEVSDMFEELVNCVYAESGNQCDEGVRLVAAVILNRADRKLENVHKVISSPYQFSSYSDGGMQKWNNPPERIWQICRKELESPTNLTVRYFRTGHYSEYGTPWRQVGDHFFSL